MVKSSAVSPLSTDGNNMYTLKYREPGKRPNTERWATRQVESVRAAVEWMNANKERAFLPASVHTNSWRTPQVVAILGPL